jgi:putative ABC transport system permease protein
MFSRLSSLWRNVARRKSVENDLSDELRTTFEILVDEKVAAGLSAAEAHRQARLEMGSDESAKEEVRDIRRGAALDMLLQDTHFAFRQFRRAPGFTMVAVVTLALGIGANAAIFGVVKSLLLDALPYRNADRLVRVQGHLAEGTQGVIAWRAAVVQRIRDRQKSFDMMAAFDSPRDATYGSGEATQIAKIEWVEPALFRMLGVEAALGRTLNDEDRAVGHVPASGAEVGPDTARAVMITDQAWERLFGRSDSIVGREVRINGLVRTVIGVLPRAFVGPGGPADFYLGFDLAPALQTGAGWLGLVGRLKPGISQDMARREFEKIDLSETTGNRLNLVVTALPLREAMEGGTGEPLLVLLASAALVLLIACTNLAGVQLSRSLARRRELAVRVAMGAGRRRIVRQLLTESVLLSLMGGVAGLALAQTALVLIRSLAAPLLPSFVTLSLDPGALLVTGAIAVCAGLAFGIGPALSIGRTDPQAILREGSRGSSEGRRARRVRGALMATQVAMCAALLAGAGLLGRTLFEMTSAPLGFNAKGVLAANARLLPKDYPTLESRLRLHQQLLERLRQLPGVEAVAIANKPPALDPRRNAIRLEGEPPGADRMVVHTSVSDDYFKTLRIPAREGRTFDGSEISGGPIAVVISESLSRREFPDGRAVGRRLVIGAQPATIVGIVADVRNDVSRLDSEPQMYISHRQDSTGRICVLLRTTADPLSYVKLVQRELSAIDGSLALTRADTLGAIAGEVLAPRQLAAILTAAFGVLALLLACVGVYAMFASMAAAQEREFGVRLALGSRPVAIAALIIRQGAGWMAAGFIGGAVGILLVVRLLSRWVYGIPAFDAYALGGAVLILLSCAAVALLIPVRRATRVDPILILRAD